MGSEREDVSDPALLCPFKFFPRSPKSFEKTEQDLLWGGEVNIVYYYIVCLQIVKNLICSSHFCLNKKASQLKIDTWYFSVCNSFHVFLKTWKGIRCNLPPKRNHFSEVNETIGTQNWCFQRPSECSHPHFGLSCLGRLNFCAIDQYLKLFLSSFFFLLRTAFKA